MTLRPITVIPLAVFVCIVAIFGIYLWQVGPGGKDISELPSALINKPAPQFDLPPIEGRKDGLKTSDLIGKGVVLVNVWASWCAPCRAENPVLMTLARDGVKIFGINYKDKPADATRYLENLGNPYRRIGADRDGRVAIDWGVYGYPETFIVDGKGRIRYRHVGPINPGELDGVMLPLIRKVAAE